MKAQRLNLIPSVRRGLIASGYSTVKVVAAVNSALGELAAKSAENKLAAGTVTKDGYKVTETTTTKYEGKRTLPLLFDAWHSCQEKATKIAEQDTTEIPAVFTSWLDKMKATKEETAKEQAEMVPSGGTKE